MDLRLATFGGEKENHCEDKIAFAECPSLTTVLKAFVL